MDPQIMTLLLALIGVGALAGFGSGIFGIGGGGVIVPALFFAFSALDYEPGIAMLMAVGTSASVIIVNSIRSAQGHHAKGAVDWAMIWPKNPLAGWGLWIGIGALAASLFVGKYVSGEIITIIFGSLLFLIALQFIFGRPNWTVADELPGGAAPAVLGSTLGGLCGVMGIGFGSLGVTMMTIFGKAIHKAIGTAAALGLFIGVPATLGYIVTGLDVAGRPPFSFGYVNLLGFAVIASVSVLCVPLGVRAAHALPQGKLRYVFGVCLLLLAASMVYKAAT